MGSLLSRPVKYVHTKVDEAKQAVWTRIDNTKNYIYTSINDTKSAITNRVVNTKNAISTAIQTRINNTKTAIFTRVDNTKKACTNTAMGIKNGVQRRVRAVTGGVCMVTNGVRHGVGTVVTSVASVGSAVTGGVLAVKSSVGVGVTRTRTYVSEAYQRTSQRRLSWFEKVKYAVLLSLLLLIVIVSGMLLWDAYNGDMDAAKHKINAIYTFVYNASLLGGQLLLRLSSTCLSYTYDGLQIAGGYVLVWSQIALTQMSYAANVTQVYSVEGAKIGVKYTVIASQTVGHFINESAHVSAEYISAGSKVTWEYLVYMCERSWMFTKYASGRGIDFVVYATEMTIYSLRVILVYLGSTLKSFAIHLLNATEVILKYMIRVTNAGAALAAQWSMEAALWSAEMLKYAATDGRVKLWANLKVLAYDLCTGSYTVSELLLDTSSFVLRKTFRGVVVFSHWSMNALCTASDWTLQSAKVTADGVVMGTIVVYHTTYDATVTSYNAVCVTLTWTYDTVCSVSYTTYDYTYTVLSTIFNVVFITCTFLYTQTIAIVQFTAYWVVTVVTFLWQWLSYIVLTISHILDVTLNRFGVRYLLIACHYITQWSLALGEIVFAFLCEVGTYLGRFCYTTGIHAYNVAYIVCAFLWQLVSGVAGVIKMFVHLLVYCVTAIFQVVLWFVDEFMLAYLYMLQQYNMYRELLFFGFIVLITFYCSGLMQDRTVTAVPADDIDDDEFDGDDSCDDDDNDEVGQRYDNDGRGDFDHSRESLNAGEKVRESHRVPVRKTKMKPPTTLKMQPPPVYMDRSVIPAYDEIDDNEDDEDIAIGDHLSDDSDLDSDFDLDAIPDVMDDTDSDTELLPSRIDELTPPKENSPDGAISLPDDPVVAEEDYLATGGTTDVAGAANNSSEDLSDSDWKTFQRNSRQAETEGRQDSWPVGAEGRQDSWPVGAEGHQDSWPAGAEEDEFQKIEELGEFPDIDQSGDELEEGKNESE